MRNIKYRNDDVFHSRTMKKMMLVSRLSRLQIPQKSHPWTASRNLTHASTILITQMHTMRARAREWDVWQELQNRSHDNNSMKIASERQTLKTADFFFKMSSLCSGVGLHACKEAKFFRCASLGWLLVSRSERSRHRWRWNSSPPPFVD